MSGPDLLKQIDDGIVRHQAEPPTIAGTLFCLACDDLWPCETLKALQGWREAQAKADRYNVQAKQQHDLAKAAEAKLREAVVKLRDEEERHAQLQSRCFEGFPSVSDGVFDALREAVVEGERLKAEVEHCNQLLRDAEVLYQEELQDCKATEAKLKDAEQEIERLKEEYEGQENVER